LTPENWRFILKELERVTKPGGWIELVEFAVTNGNAGPNLKKVNGWLKESMMLRGVNLDIALDPGLKFLLEEANVINVHEDILRIPLYEGGGEVAKLMKEDTKLAESFFIPLISRTFGIPLEEVKEVCEASCVERDELKSYLQCFIAWGQKKEVSIVLD
jgi:hypothetical protein